MGPSWHIGHTCVGSWACAWHTMSAQESDRLYQLSYKLLRNNLEALSMACGCVSCLLPAPAHTAHRATQLHRLPSPEGKIKKFFTTAGHFIEMLLWAMCGPPHEAACAMTGKQAWLLMCRPSSATTGSRPDKLTEVENAWNTPNTESSLTQQHCAAPYTRRLYPVPCTQHST